MIERMDQPDYQEHLQLNKYLQLVARRENTYLRKCVVYLNRALERRIMGLGALDLGNIGDYHKKGTDL